MAQEKAASDALTRHVFGPADPSVSLLEAGRFPPGWVEEYRRLLAVVAEEWAAAPAWPRHMVGALHYALTHLRVRYSARQRFEGGGRRDEETERELSRVEAPTRIVFARAFPPEEPRHAEPGAAADGGGMTAFQGSWLKQPPPPLSGVVRRREEAEEDGRVSRGASGAIRPTSLRFGGRVRPRRQPPGGVRWAMKGADVRSVGAKWRKGFSTA
jgi:hypothetical protein